MSDASINDLTARIEALEAETERLREQLVQAQIDQWKGRIDDLDVQMHLGALDLRDKLQPVVDQFRSNVADARARLGTAASTADDVLANLRKGFDKAVDDISKAVRQARESVGS